MYLRKIKNNNNTDYHIDIERECYKNINIYREIWAEEGFLFLRLTKRDHNYIHYATLLLYILIIYLYYIFSAYNIPRQVKITSRTSKLNYVEGLTSRCR